MLWAENTKDYGGYSTTSPTKEQIAEFEMLKNASDERTYPVKVRYNEFKVASIVKPRHLGDKIELAGGISEESITDRYGVPKEDVKLLSDLGMDVNNLSVKEQYGITWLEDSNGNCIRIGKNGEISYGLGRTNDSIFMDGESLRETYREYMSAQMVGSEYVKIKSLHSPDSKVWENVDTILANRHAVVSLGTAYPIAASKAWMRSYWSLYSKGGFVRTTVNKPNVANAAQTGGKRIVLGENMDRVRIAAQKLNAETFEGVGMDANKAWIQLKKQQGYEIFDIGPDFNRRFDRFLQGQKPDSIFYNMERIETKNYPVNQLWERQGKFQGGSWFIGE